MKIVKYFLFSISLLIYSQLSIYCQKKDYSIEDFISGSTYQQKTFNEVIPANDGTSFYYNNGKKLLKYSFISGEIIDTILNFSNPLISKIGIPEEISINTNESLLLISFDSDELYRNSFYAKYYCYDLKNKSIIPIADTSYIRLVSFSSDGSKVSYVANNNLFFQDLTTGSKLQITYDGKSNSILNGTPDWVYEEEFSLEQAYQWSPDGKSIAFHRFDETEIKEYPLIVYGNNNYPKVNYLKYPKAGEKNSKVEIWVYEITSQKLRKMDIGTDTNQYIPQIKWSNQTSKLAIVRLNRRQNKLDILLANTKNGSSNLIYSEINKKYIDELPQNYITFIDSNDNFLFTSEQSGFNHIYLYNEISAKQLTTGNYEVQKVLGFDKTSKTIFYVASEKMASQTEVYSIKTDGTNKTLISKETGTNEAIFSSNFKYFINKFSNYSTPINISIYETSGNKVKCLIDNHELTEKIRKDNLPLKVPFRYISPPEGNELNCWIIKPIDFDSTKKYPVLVYVYGGPGFQTVVDKWKIDWFNYLATQGFVIVSTDARGTSGRGEALKKVTYENLGYYEAIDQINFAKYISKFPFIDSSRLSIYGWSFGGYLSAMCLMKGLGLFRSGISVAPVTDWKFYDSVYTERYMGLPSENEEGYKNSSLLQYADSLKSKMLLIHGTNDDNVHFQNTMAFSERLIKKGKQFEMQVYPDRTHNLRGGNSIIHVYTKMTEFLKQ